MHDPIMITGRGDGLKIRLALWSGGGQNILCVHGITANCRCWDVIAAALAPKYRVLAMDLRGRGHSDKPKSGYSVEHHCRDMAALVEDLKLVRPVVMGHSLGAFISLAFAARYPDLVDRIILVDGGGDLSKEQMDKVFSGIKPALDRLGKVFPSAEAYMESMRQAPYLQPWSPALETYYRYEIVEVKGGVRTNIDPAHIQEEAENVRKMVAASLYPKVTCRVLILRATEGLLARDDILIPKPVAERMVREIPKARAVDIDGTNHYGIIFRPSAVRDKAIIDFLEDQGAPS
jgi:pimeloyl-ACP methyl ester carboxylesterase